MSQSNLLDENSTTAVSRNIETNIFLFLEYYVFMIPMMLQDILHRAPRRPEVCREEGGVRRVWRRG